MTLKSLSQLLIWAAGTLVLAAGPMASAQISDPSQGVFPFAQDTRATVALVALGGTIAGVAPSPNDPNYKAGQLPIDTMIKSVPGVENLAHLVPEQLLNVPSAAISEANVLQIVRELNTLLAKPGIHGAVVTMGTDTLSDLSYYLHLLVKSEKPVVVVGAMRASNQLGADGPANLYNAIAVAANPSSKGQGVMVVMNDQVLSASNVIKMNTTRVDTFAALTGGPLADVRMGTISWYRNMRSQLHTARSEFSADGRTELPKVRVIPASLATDMEPVEEAIAKGVKLFVLEGTGDGTLTNPAIQFIKSRIDPQTGFDRDGVIFVRASEVTSGWISQKLDVFPGTVTARSLTPGKAKILLQLASTVTQDPREIQEIFDVYAGPDLSGAGFEPRRRAPKTRPAALLCGRVLAP